MPGLSGYPADGVDCCYNPETAPVKVGKIPDTFRQLPGVVRSWDPTHSFCAWGRDKEYFVRNHHKLPTMDKYSPLGLLEQAGGYCLMIGCCTAVTFMHVVETSCGAHCLGQRAEEYTGIINGDKPSFMHLMAAFTFISSGMSVTSCTALYTPAAIISGFGDMSTP